MQITKEEAKAILLKPASNNKSYAQVLYELWLDSFDEANEKIGHERHIHNRTVFANLIASYMVNKVKRFVVQESEYSNSVSFIVHRKMTILVIENKLAIRFKKLNKKYLASNIVTNQVEDFSRHKIDFLDDDSPMLSLNSGYNVDALGSSIDEIYFVCPDGLVDVMWKLATYDLAIAKPHTIFEVEEDILPVVSIKPNLKKRNEKATG